MFLTFHPTEIYHKFYYALVQDIYCIFAVTETLKLSLLPWTCTFYGNLKIEVQKSACTHLKALDEINLLQCFSS